MLGLLARPSRSCPIQLLKSSLARERHRDHRQEGARTQMAGERSRRQPPRRIEPGSRRAIQSATRIFARTNVLPRHDCTSRPASNDNPGNSFRATDDCPNLPDSYPQIMTHPPPGGALVSNENGRVMRSGNVAHIAIESIIAPNSTASLCNFNLRLAHPVPSQSSGPVQSRRLACANSKFKQERDPIHF